LCSKSPIPANSISWPNSSTAAASATPGGSNTPPVDKSFNFVQFVLEDDNEDQSVHLQSPASINDYDFIPVLLWKPNLTKNCNPTKPKIITSQSHTDHDANDNHRARINKMNITGNLPIRKQSVAVFHVSILSLLVCYYNEFIVTPSLVMCMFFPLFSVYSTNLHCYEL
jgi:hypothetical protein